jgi:TetR/AcrR family transcriptional regulator, transcriptional repressor for nem operon
MLPSTRQRIVDAADRLFYERGFESTSFADIAEAVGISRGNFYHHFKTKDEILDAVIQSRLAQTRAMLDRWEIAGTTPMDRIHSFIGILLDNQTAIMASGCPVGTLCSELSKLGHPAQGEAAELFLLFRTWLRRQFTLLGCKGRSDALALHLLARSQGVATLAQAFHDEAFVRQEVRQMREWLASCTAPAPRLSR